MSCQLGVFAYFKDTAKVRTFLFPNDDAIETSQEENEGDGWDEDWGSWNDEMDTPDRETEEQGSNPDMDHSWLQHCILSLSPANDIMAMAYLDKCVILSQKFDRNGSNGDVDTAYTVVWQGTLSQEEGETITAIMCLPLASQKRSTQGAPDWTCLIVGFSTGHIRMYTENGTMLLSQLLHTEPVQKLKCRTYEPPRFLGLAEQHEELVILFQRALVTIDGFSLVQSLRACRNQLARAAASGNDTVFQPPPLAYKKWGLQDQESISDFASCGVDTPNPFDHMKTASMLGGPQASFRPTPPAAGLYVTSGIGHYVGFFYAIEGSTQPILSEVAYAVAHKLKSALMSAASGWLGFGGKQKDEVKQRPKIEPATPLCLRFGLPDKRRHGDTVYLSPNNNYVATTDSFGRVILIDVLKGIAIRMWKGYRDAQLGWVQVREDGQNSHRDTEQTRVAQFLIIYAPRRGILEVWSAGHGPRVAAFNVSKNCTLLCPSYGMMGLNNVTARGIKTKAFQCALVDPEGTIKTLDIPFHLALSDKNNKRARDLHLLKMLKTLLKESSQESDETMNSIKDLLRDMRTANIMQQGMDRVLACKYLSPEGINKILKSCAEQITKRGEENLDLDSKMFVKYCELQQKLVELYLSLHHTAESKEKSDDDIPLSQKMEECLGLIESEALHIVTQIEQHKSVAKATNSKKVHFSEDQTLSVQDFLNCFLCQPQAANLEAKPMKCISLKSYLTVEKKVNLGAYLFEYCLHHSDTNCVGIYQETETLSPELLKDILMEYWISSDNRDVETVLSLHNLLKVLIAKIDHKTQMSWLQAGLSSCIQTCNSQASYLLAVAFRSLATGVENAEKDSQKKDDEESENPEANKEAKVISTAMTDSWDLLVKQLEDVLALNSLLQIPLDKEEAVKVSVQKVLEGGRGAIAEIVGSDLAWRNIKGNDLFRTYLQDSTEKMEISSPAEDESNHMISGIQVSNCLLALQQRFPHSLENDVLLSNCCWENAVIWNKDVQLIQKFTDSLEFLKLIQNAVLRHGLASMLWQMFVTERFASLAQLMEKVGKVPKDRLCRKELGVGESSLPQLIGCMVDLIQSLMEANCEVNEVPVFNIEPAWQKVRGPNSLVDLANETKMTNYGLIRHHFHLAVMMQAIIVFGMKSVKVVSLFDSKGKHAFHCDFTQHPLLPSQNIDVSISSQRKQFLSRVITHAVQTLDGGPSTSKTSGSLVESPSMSSPLKKKSSAAVKWPALVQDLAKDFGLDLDHFKRHHVCELYSSGYDKAAEEVLITVNDHEAVGSQLLQIAGKRINHYLLVTNKMEGVDLLSSVSPALSTWIRSLNLTDLRKAESSVQYIALLVQHVANNLPEGYPEYELALGLVDLVQSMSK